MPVEQGDHIQEVQQLLDKVKLASVPSHSITNVEQRAPKKFVPVGKIEPYLRDDQYQRARDLLRVIFGTSPAPIADQVVEKCCRVLCILAELNQIQYVGSFVRYQSLWDESLPFNPNGEPAHFPTNTGMRDFYKRFCEEQWKYCAPELSWKTNGVEFEEHAILPFIELNYAGGGGSSTVYKAVIHAQHDKLVRPDSRQPGSNSNHCYAIKRYRKGRNAQRNYEQESEAFRKITESGVKSAPGIIEFYGSFEYQGSFNIILEYAGGGTLETFWQEHDRPSGGSNFIAYWKSIFEVVDGIRWLHNHRLPLDGKSDHISEHGWHQDVKPDNILVVNGGLDPNYKGSSFKIADFQLAHFKTIMEDGAEATTLSKIGTHTYGAPECCDPLSLTKHHPHHVKRCIDIWSLGCILSEAAVWAVKGNAGLQRYRSARRSAIRRIQGHGVTDCFHDEKELLPAVTEQHRDLSSDYDRDDFITGPVISKMIKKMLRHQPSKRLTAEQLIDEAEETVSDATIHLENATKPESPSSGGASQTLPMREREPSDVFEGQNHSVIGTHRSILNEDDKFMASPRGTTHQTDAAIAGHAFKFGSPALHTSGLYVDVNPTTPVRTGRSETLQSTQRLDIVSSPVSAPPSQDGAVSQPAQSPPSPSKRKDPMPTCTVDQAWNWHNLRKNGHVNAQLPDHWLVNDLKNRDHVFMIDDSRSMYTYWREVRDLSHLLMYIVKEKDPDGPDLFFLSSDDQLHPKTSTKMEQLINNRKPKGNTSLDGCLNNDLVSYGKKLDMYSRTYGEPRPPRKRSLYILTDGILGHGGDNQGQEAIRQIVGQVQRAKLFRGQVGIQFISFGNDDKGLKRLEKLDRLNEDGSLGLDLVDTEPWNGNVWKMLLGAINEKFDDDPISPVPSRRSLAQSPH